MAAAVVVVAGGGVATVAGEEVYAWSREHSLPMPPSLATHARFSSFCPHKQLNAQHAFHTTVVVVVVVVVVVMRDTGNNASPATAASSSARWCRDRDNNATRAPTAFGSCRTICWFFGHLYRTLPRHNAALSTTTGAGATGF